MLTINDSQNRFLTAFGMTGFLREREGSNGGFAAVAPHIIIKGESFRT